AALGATGPTDGGAARWLLTAALARELADGPHRDLSRAVGLASAAVEGARAAGEAGVLAYALFALADVRWEPGTATERLSIAGELAAAAAAAGERIGEPDTWGVQASQLAGLAYIRHDWTRLSKLAAARGQAIMPPEFALHLRAWLLLEAGEKAAAAALVASIPDGPTMYRWRHTAMLTSDAEIAAAAGERNRCATRYEQLLPMADEFAVVGAAVFTTGPVALQLGLLAAALGRWDDAAVHLDDAARRCDRLGAVLLAARARTELARVRAAQGQAPPVNGGGTNVFRREGDTWTLAFGGRGVALRDAKGLRDLAVLLAAPG